jgi:hypothetical protein
MISTSNKQPLSSCSVKECANVLASYNLEVIPKADKWQNKFHWSPPSCGPIPTYYIVDIRYAVSDTNAFYNIRNAIGSHTIRVAAVNLRETRLSLFSEETNVPDITPLYGINHNTPSVPCTYSIQMK